MLVLLGFAATDFVITKTLCSADAAVHLIQNPLLGRVVGRLAGAVFCNREQLIVTMFLLVLLGASFMRGFKEVIGLAVVIVAVYLFLNVIVIGSGLVYLLLHGDLISTWYRRSRSGPTGTRSNTCRLRPKAWISLILISLLIFPKLALGLSGFETGVAVMPLIRGASRRRAAPTARAHPQHAQAAADGGPDHVGLPARLVARHGDADAARGAGHREAAPPNARWPIWPTAKRRYNDQPALRRTSSARSTTSARSSSLASPGASAMAGLLNLVPQYLPRYGMAPEWARAVRPLVILFTVINLLRHLDLRRRTSRPRAAPTPRACWC